MKFMYDNRFTNKLADKITKKAHSCNAQTAVFYYSKTFFSFIKKGEHIYMQRREREERSLFIGTEETFFCSPVKIYCFI